MIILTYVKSLIIRQLEGVVSQIYISIHTDVPNDYASRTVASLFVAQIVRTANEMSSTDNATPTNKNNNNNNKTNNDMNKQLI